MATTAIRKHTAASTLLYARVALLHHPVVDLFDGPQQEVRGASVAGQQPEADTNQHAHHREDCDAVPHDSWRVVGALERRLRVSERVHPTVCSSAKAGEGKGKGTGVGPESKLHQAK